MSRTAATGHGRDGGGQDEPGKPVDQIRMPEGTHLAYQIIHEDYWWNELGNKERRAQILSHDGQPCIEVWASTKGQGGPRTKAAKWTVSIVEVSLDDQLGPFLRSPFLRLEAINDDAWEAFTSLAPFFARLAGLGTLAEVRNLLDELGAVDETQRKKLTWADRFPNGRFIFYEGDDPDGFVELVKDEFGFDPSADPAWGVPAMPGPTGEPREPWDPFGRPYGFHCPAEHLNAIYGSRRFRMGS